MEKKEHGQRDVATAEVKAKEVPKCEECKENPSKYKCPGCAIRSCSLNCVKSHKRRTGCDGKRNVTQFVPLSKFDDNVLISDYNVLEDAKRVAESAQRLRLKLCRYNHFKLPFFLRNLRSAAASRRTKLLLLPSGMSKRENNQTRYDQRRKSISWTVEWRFHSTDVALVDHGVGEDKTLSSVLEKHLKPGPWIHKLIEFCNESLDSLKFFIRKYPKGPKSPFREIDIKAPLRHQLANVTILEYPVIHVFLASHSCGFEIVKDVNPIHPRNKLDPSDSGLQSPKGQTFREEEFEDNASQEPRVLNLSKPVNFGPVTQQGSLTGKESTTALGPNLDFSPTEGGPETNMNFDFDQGLIDTYSDLIAEINPDDFLDLEGLFGRDSEGDIPNLQGIFSADEELEEGEIAE